MPTIHQERGFRFIIYFDDHEPAHVHVWHAGVVARIDIGDSERRPKVIDAGVMRPRVLRQAIRIVEHNQEAFFAAWRRHHDS